LSLLIMFSLIAGAYAFKVLKYTSGFGMYMRPKCNIK
jgi:hypothetical protein